MWNSNVHVLFNTELVVTIDRWDSFRNVLSVAPHLTILVLFPNFELVGDLGGSFSLSIPKKAARIVELS